jgi:hypothetical protein
MKGPVTGVRPAEATSRSQLKSAFDGALHGGEGDLFHLLGAVGRGRHPALEDRDLALGQGQHQFGILAVFADVGHAVDLQSQVEQVDGGFQPQVMAHD